MISLELQKMINDMTKAELVDLSGAIRDILCAKANSILKELPYICPNFIAGKCNTTGDICDRCYE